MKKLILSSLVLAMASSNVMADVGTAEGSYNFTADVTSKCTIQIAQNGASGTLKFKKDFDPLNNAKTSSSTKDKLKSGGLRIQVTNSNYDKANVMVTQVSEDLTGSLLPAASGKSVVFNRVVTIDGSNSNFYFKNIDNGSPTGVDVPNGKDAYVNVFTTTINPEDLKGGTYTYQSNIKVTCKNNS